MGQEHGQAIGRPTEKQGQGRRQILMYPAATLSMSGVIMVATVFAVATLATMQLVVIPAYFGLAKFSFPGLHRFSHAIAGGTIALCGAAIQLDL